MTTYNSYEAAKIANPESDIFKFQEEFTLDSNRFGLALPICNPADHCMTVEKFLADGHRFVSGDMVFDDGEVETINSRHDIEAYNEKERLDRERFILLAAALERKESTGEYGGIYELKNQTEQVVNELSELMSEAYRDSNKTKRMKVEYEKHNVNDEGGKYWEVARDWTEGNVEFRFKRNDGNYCLINSNDELLRFYKNKTLYIRMEKEITERDEFVETALSAVRLNHLIVVKDAISELFDSGKFKLVCEG